MALSHLIISFGQHLSLEGKSPHTVRAYRVDIQLFFDFLREYWGHPCSMEDMKALTLSTLRAWLSFRLQKGYDVQSTARAVSTLRTFFRFLKTQGFELPTLLLRAPRRSRLLPRPLSEEQALDFLEKIPEISPKDWVGLRDVALFTLIYSIGLRISEALSLNQGDFLNAQGYLSILGKGAKERHVPLLPRVQRVVGDYLKTQPFACNVDAPLFFGIQGKRLSPEVARRQIQRYRALYGLPDTFTPHALRHSCATHLVNSSDNLRGVQELLGHASLSTTQIYTDVEQEKIFTLYQKLHPRG